MGKEQRSILFSGAVQGVGFRFTACRAAGSHEVAGYVRNLRDGRVECLVEGEASEIDAFLADLRQRMAGYVQSCTQQTAAYTGRYTQFSVSF